jgi:enoyl-CoA hydratase/carnithine racemase
MEDSAPKLQVAGQIARITFNRPRHKNRLQPEDIATLHEMFTRLAVDPEVRAVIITGTGDAFSAGFDLNALAAGHVGDAESGPGNFALMVDALERLPQPSIARLSGGVYGGATDLALACDFRIGVMDMAAAMPAARIGLHYYKSGILRYASRLGHDNAKRMFLTAARLDAPELLRIGFLTQLVEPAALDETVDALAETLAGNAPLAVQGVKLALNELARQAWDEAAFTSRAAAALASDDLREGLAAVQAKRKPVFEGR